jgi:hypothetical protein
MKKSFYFSIVMFALFAAYNVVYSQVTPVPSYPIWDLGNSIGTQIQYVGWEADEALELQAFFVANPFEDAIVPPPLTLDDCYNSPDPDCVGGWSAWINNCKAVVKHPTLFPYCPIEVTFSYRYCLSNYANVQTKITKFAYRPNNWIERYSCNARANYMNTGTLEERSRKANQLECDLSGLLAKYFFTKMNALNTIYCNTTNVPTKISYTKGSCSGYCYTTYYTTSGQEKTIITASNCTPGFCCRFENTFCIDPKTGRIIHTTQKTTSQTQSCAGYVPLNNCPPGVIVTSTPCISSCDVEFLNLGN